MSDVLHFPDIYSGSKGINFSSSYLVICKASQGINESVNPEFKTSQANAKGWNVFFTAYHFLEHGNVAKQAQAAFNVVGPNVPLALDSEPYLSSHPTIADTEAFIDAYSALGGKCHLTYLPHWYWEDMGEPDLSGLVNRKQFLWTSNYPDRGYSDDGPGWVGYGTMQVAVWQYSATTPYGGIADVDFNAFRGSGKATSLEGTLAEFKSLVTTGSYQGK